MKVTLPHVTQQNVKINNFGGTLTSAGSVTLKNQINELSSIQNIPDVDEVNVTSGATLVYNSSNDKYEIKLLNFSDIDGSLDAGTF